MNQRPGLLNRREFVQRVTVAAAVGAAALRVGPAQAEPPPETTRIRLYKIPGLCLAPQYVAEELLRAEGFTDVQYLSFPEGGAGVYERLGKGDIDFTQWFIAPFVQAVLPAVMAAFLTVPAAMLGGAYLWQLLPNHLAVRWSGWQRQPFTADSRNCISVYGR